MTVIEIKIGDDSALVLPKEVAMALGLEEGQCLRAERLPDGSVKIGPYDPTYDKGMRIARKVFVEYAEVFRALAKS